MISGRLARHRRRGSMTGQNTATRLVLLCGGARAYGTRWRDFSHHTHISSPLPIPSTLPSNSYRHSSKVLILPVGASIVLSHTLHISRIPTRLHILELASHVRPPITPRLAPSKLGRRRHHSWPSIVCWLLRGHEFWRLPSRQCPVYLYRPQTSHSPCMLRVEEMQQSGSKE